MIYLHIGVHKTGTTSIQQFIDDRRALLRAQGYALYQGLHVARNHTELHLACLQAGRDSFGAFNRPGCVGNESYRGDIAARVQGFLAQNSDARDVIFTNEGLCLLRHEEEMSRLKALFASRPDQVRVIVFLREAQSFLSAYQRQIYRRPGRTESSDPASAFYVGRDSWLADFKTLVSLYQVHFGEKNVVAQSFEDHVARDGNIIPAFLRAIELAPTPALLDETKRYRLNASG